MVLPNNKIRVGGRSPRALHHMVIWEGNLHHMVVQESTTLHHIVVREGATLHCHPQKGWGDSGHLGHHPSCGIGRRG